MRVTNHDIFVNEAHAWSEDGHVYHAAKDDPTPGPHVLYPHSRVLPSLLPPVAPPGGRGRGRADGSHHPQSPASAPTATGRAAGGVQPRHQLCQQD